MPTYQYACTACGHRFEAVQSFSDASLTDCPECTGRLRKVFSSVGIVFKGSGFYDRTLPLVHADIALVVVLDDGELIDELPTEPHDRRVTAALLPESGVTMLGQTD